MGKFARWSHGLVSGSHLPALALVTLNIVLLGGVGFLITERNQLQGSLGQMLLDSLWWAFVTMTTIGYGDIVPHTAWGRVVGSLVGLSGVVVLSIITAILASILVEKRIMEDRGLQRVRAVDHWVVCGWNSHAENVLVGLSKHSSDSLVVLVNDLDPDHFADIRYQFKEKLRLKFVKGDYTHESVLDKASVGQAASCIILVDTAGEHQILRSDERAIKGTLTIKSINPKVRVCVELLDRHSEPHLARARADEIIVRGEYTGLFLSSAACSPGLSRVVDELVGPRSAVTIERMTIPSEFLSKTYGELTRHLAQTQGCTALGLQKDVQEIKIDDILADDMSVIDKFIRRKFMESGTSLEDRLSASSPYLNPPQDQKLESYTYAIVMLGGGSR